MDHPQTYLLKKIVGYKENGLESLGHLDAKHVNDISKVMLDFSKETVIEAVNALLEGKTINMDGTVLSLQKIKRSKHSTHGK